MPTFVTPALGLIPAANLAGYLGSALGFVTTRAAAHQQSPIAHQTARSLASACTESHSDWHLA
jgi:hypothetical protein